MSEKIRVLIGEEEVDAKIRKGSAPDLCAERRCVLYL